MAAGGRTLQVKLQGEGCALFSLETSKDAGVVFKDVKSPYNLEYAKWLRSH